MPIRQMLIAGDHDSSNHGRTFCIHQVIPTDTIACASLQPGQGDHVTATIIQLLQTAPRHNRCSAGSALTVTTKEGHSLLLPSLEAHSHWHTWWTPAPKRCPLQTEQWGGCQLPAHLPWQLLLQQLTGACLSEQPPWSSEHAWLSRSQRASCFGALLCVHTGSIQRFATSSMDVLLGVLRGCFRCHLGMICESLERAFWYLLVVNDFCIVKSLSTEAL